MPDKFLSFGEICSLIYHKFYFSNSLLEGEWDQLVGSVKKSWGKLTDNDLAKVKGQKDKLVGLIEEKYGDTKEAIEKKLNDIMKKMD